MKNLSVTLKMAIIGIVVIAFMMFSINFSINSMQAINTRIARRGGEHPQRLRRQYQTTGGAGYLAPR